MVTWRNVRHTGRGATYEGIHRNSRMKNAYIHVTRSQGTKGAKCAFIHTSRSDIQIHVHEMRQYTTISTSLALSPVPPPRAQHVFFHHLKVIPVLNCVCTFCTSTHTLQCSARTTKSSEDWVSTDLPPCCLTSSLRAARAPWGVMSTK